MATLAIEAGGTSSTAFLVTPEGVSKLFKFGAANYQLVTSKELESQLKDLEVKLKDFSNCAITKVGIAFPGIFEDDKPVAKMVVKTVWPEAENIWVGTDLESALACLGNRGYERSQHELHCVLVSGTGSCAFGTNGITTAKVGGNGHVIGDSGSGYFISQQGIRASLQEYERNDGRSHLLDSLMSALDVKQVQEIVRWSTAATKSKIASLAPVVLNSWNSGDCVATKVVQEVVEDLSLDLCCLVNKLADPLTIDNGNPLLVKIGFTGSLLTEDHNFRNEVTKRIQSNLANSMGGMKLLQFEVLENTVKGAFIMVSKMKSSQLSPAARKISANATEIIRNSKELYDLEMTEEELCKKILPISTCLSPTECRNPSSFLLDRMSIEDAIDLWLIEESSFHTKIGNEKMILKKLIIQVTNTIRNGGRLFYVGSGTSGRLGILDASECPPTFSTPSYVVQGIISGGKEAMFSSIEGAEDSIVAGMLAVDEHGITSKDLVMGIACSGRTPFAWGAVYRAKNLNAFTAFLTFNPNIVLQHQPDILLSINVGPEILTGSTRLKSGSATKCILNMITTLAMVQLGKCLENLMVGVSPSNNKLKDRALRIVMTILNGDQSVSSEEDGKEANYERSDVLKILQTNNYDIKKTVREMRGEEEAQVIIQH